MHRRTKQWTIHHAPNFTTVWLVPLPADQHYWSSARAVNGDGVR